MFVWLISHQLTVLFSQNKPAISNQPAVFFSQNKSAPAISHQPNEQAVDLGPLWEPKIPPGSPLLPRAEPPLRFWPRVDWSVIWKPTGPGRRNPNPLFSPCRVFPTSRLVTAPPRASSSRLGGRRLPARLLPHLRRRASPPPPRRFTTAPPPAK
jgi:hypothetical protein